MILGKDGIFRLSSVWAVWLFAPMTPEAGGGFVPDAEVASSPPSLTVACRLSPV